VKVDEEFVRAYTYRSENNGNHETESDQRSLRQVPGIHQMALIVDDLEKARHFSTEILGLQELPALAFDYPVQF